LGGLLDWLQEVLDLESQEHMVILAALDTLALVMLVAGVVAQVVLEQLPPPQSLEVLAVMV
jgi:hypothetical protein